MTPSEESSAPPVKRPTGFSVIINGQDIFPPVANEYKEQMVAYVYSYQIIITGLTLCSRN